MPNTRDDGFDLKQLIVEFDPGKLHFSPQPLPPMQELVPSVAASIPPITADSPSNASVRADMNAAKTSVENRMKVLMQSDPILCQYKSEHYGIQVNAAPFMKGKEGSGKVFTAIIDHILTQSGAVKSQAQIRSYVAEMFPSHTMPRDWTKPLLPWAATKIRQRIQGSAAPISNIQLPKVVTLSLLHKSAAAAIERHKTGVQKFRPVVEVSENSVIINGVVFPIKVNKVQGGIYNYKHMQAQMPTLLQALELGR